MARPTKEQTTNYNDMIKLISKMSNPSERDIDYLQGIMKGKKYTSKNRVELNEKLSQLEASTKNTVKFETEEPEEAPKDEAQKVVVKAKKLTRGEVTGESDTPVTDREKVFKEIRDELFILSDKCLKYSRGTSGGTAMRLAQASKELSRIAKIKLQG